MNLAAAAVSAQAGHRFSVAEMRQLCGEALRPGLDQEALALLLTALADRGETAEEIQGAAEALRANCVPFPSMPARAVDTCGTGGDGKSSFNISTAAALVAAAAGAPVVKHGNRSVSSSCGSADLLEAAGVHLQLSPAAAAEVLEACGMVFLYAPAFHPAMAHVAPVRRQLGRRSLFNYVGPLAHPGGVQRQLLGVAEAARLTDYAQILRGLGVTHAYVVHGADGADEMTLAGENHVVAVGEAGPIPLAASDWGLQAAPDVALAGADAAHNLQLLHGVLHGEIGPLRDAVLLNAAAALLLAEIALEPLAAVALAAEAVDSGAAARCLETMASVSHRLAGVEA